RADFRHLDVRAQVFGDRAEAHVGAIGQGWGGERRRDAGGASIGIGCSGGGVGVRIGILLAAAGGEGEGEGGDQGDLGQRHSICSRGVKTGRTISGGQGCV